MRLTITISLLAGMLCLSPLSMANDASSPSKTVSQPAKPTKPAKAAKTNSSKKADKPGFSCSSLPRYCKNMDSCEQAEFALKQCGMRNLDRDRDGIPCENVCG